MSRRTIDACESDNRLEQVCMALFIRERDKRLGLLGALGSTGTFIATVTIIPFRPNGRDPAAGFPAMAGNVPFLMKDVVLLAVSIYLLKQDLVRVFASAKSRPQTQPLRA
jgi:uncharacterized membrane protein YkgB